MRSPFSIFRKYQKITMVIILFLTMLAFTLSDAVTQWSGQLPTMLIVVMMGMIGAGIGAVIGMQTGKPWEYSIAGVVVGAVVSLVITTVGGTSAAVETTAGNLTQKEIEALVQRRQTANAFVIEAYQRVAPPPQQNNPFSIEIWERGLRTHQFSNGIAMQSGKAEIVRQSLEDDVVFGYLLEQEADKMGIKVSDEAVNDYIKAIGTTQFGPTKQLTKDAFKEIRSRLRVGESDLYNALRGELRVRTALYTLAPSSLQAPEEYWKIYRQLHVREKLDVAAIPVEDFTKEVSEPTDAELDEYFERYKLVYPGQLGPDAPGFMQPRKFQVAYLEADFQEYEKKVPAVTDAEIEEYYNKNKENYKNNPFPAEPPGAPKPPAKEADDNEPLDVNLTPENEGKPAPDATKPAEPTKDGDKPAPEKAADDSSKKTPESATPPAEPAKPQENATPTPETKDEPKKGASLERQHAEKVTTVSTLIAPNASAALFGVLADENAAPAIEAKPADAAPEKPTANEGEKKSEETKPTPPADADKPAAPPTTPPAEQKPAAEQNPAADKAAPSDPSAPATPPKPDEKPPAPVYRPLDDDLKSDIRAELTRTRTKALMRDAIREATDVIFQLRNRYITIGQTGKRDVSAEEIEETMKKHAAEHGLTYHKTGFLSALELRDGGAESIGTAIDPLENQSSAANARAVWQRLLQSAPVQLYDPMTVESGLTSDLFAVWKTGDEEEHLPVLTEPGVREQVIAAWKTSQARPLAEKRATDLAELVRNAKKGMNEALGNETVTGKEGSAKITTRLTPSFSWLSESSAPETDIFQRSPPKISEVAAIKNISNEFMKTIFEQMSVGDVKAVPNRDKSVYYVVQTTERFPSDQAEENALRQTFLKENLFRGFFGDTPYRYQMRVQDSFVHRTWVNELRKKYGVRWTVDGRPEPAI